MFGVLLTSSAPNSPMNRQDVVIRGRTIQDTKRAVLKYWSRNEARLGMELQEFQRRCTWRDDGSVLIRQLPVA